MFVKIRIVGEWKMKPAGFLIFIGFPCKLCGSYGLYLAAWVTAEPTHLCPTNFIPFFLLANSSCSCVYAPEEALFPKDSEHWVTIGWLSVDSWVTVRWLSVDTQVTIGWLAVDSRVTLRWLKCDYLVTIMWLRGDSCITFGWLLGDSWMNHCHFFGWLVIDTRVTCGWLPGDFQVTRGWLGDTRKWLFNSK